MGGRLIQLLLAMSLLLNTFVLAGFVYRSWIAPPFDHAMPPPPKAICDASAAPTPNTFPAGCLKQTSTSKGAYAPPNDCCWSNSSSTLAAKSLCEFPL